MTTPDAPRPETDPLRTLAAVAASAFKAGSTYERIFGAHPDAKPRTDHDATAENPDGGTAAGAPRPAGGDTDLGRFLDRMVQEGPAIAMGLLGTVSDILSPDRPTPPPAPASARRVPPVPTRTTPPAPAHRVPTRHPEATTARDTPPQDRPVPRPPAQPTHPLPWAVHVNIPHLVVDAAGTPVGMMDTASAASTVVAAVNLGHR